ncbi:tetratricopeptide repeat protein [Myxococcota bacterium]
MDDPDQRRELAVRVAVVLAEQLRSVGEAIDAWRVVLEEFGPDSESLRALEKLLGAAARWEELGETYENHLEFCQTDGERLDLLAQLGDLRREHLGNTALALEAYRLALTIDPSHSASREALEKLLESEDGLARREAAEVLHPIYEGEGNHQRLLRVLEIEVEATDSLEQRLDYLEKALRVAEVSLNDGQRAFGYAERGLREAVGHIEPETWLDHTERLAESTARHADHVRLLCDVLPNLFDGETQLKVMLKVADLSRHRLGDRDLARAYYQKTLDVRPEERTALVALESLYEEAGDAVALLGVLQRRTEVADTDEERKQLLYRQARLLAEVLENRAGAIEVYESVVDLALEDPAVTALEHLYSEEQRWSDLVVLYGRELDQNRRDPSLIHVKIATVAARQQGNIARAFEELELALELDRQHEAAILELERLLKEAEEAEYRGRAAVLLEPVYWARADYDRVMEALRARLETCHDPDVRRELLGRLGKLYEEQKEDYVQALETTALLLQDNWGDAETVSELERLAKVAGAQERLAEIYGGVLGDGLVMDEASAKLARRTGELFDQLGQPDQALAFLHRALSFEPDNDDLFQAVDQILKRTSQHGKRVALYRQVLDHRYLPAERVSLLHTIAHLERDALGDPDQAINSYRAALDVDEQDQVALDGLTELYRQRERWNDLSELYLRRAEMAEAPERAAVFRLALARLYLKQLGDSERAIDQLEEITRTVPDHAEATHELEGLLAQPVHKQRVVEILRPLYGRSDDWRHTIKLNEERFALAEDLADKVAVLRETSSLWQRRGNDMPRAWKALRLAFELDPDDADVRGELEGLTESTGAFRHLAVAYEEILAKRSDLLSQRDIIAQLAELYDRRLDDPRQALDAYRRWHEAEPAETEPLDKMEELAMLLGDWEAVVAALTAKADQLFADEERASVWRRVGEAKRDMLDDRVGACDAYERALELDPVSASTMDCLIELHEERKDARRLVELYQRRVEQSGDDDEDLRYELLVRAARCHEDELSDRTKAIEVLGQALVVRPADRAVLGSLNRLYRNERMWPELLENLRLEAESSEVREDRIRLGKEAAHILAHNMNSYEEALDAYRAVLDEVPDDEEAIQAVRAMAEQHEDLRQAVAAILVSVLRNSGRWADLVAVLEMRLSVEADPIDRVETLRSIAEVLEGKLNQSAEAQMALLRALGERPDSMGIHEEIERLAAQAPNGWVRYADALSERAGTTFDPEIGKDLFSRLGAVCEEHLGDDSRAIGAYTRALEQAGDDPLLLEALDRLHTKTNNAHALADVLERREILTTGEADRAELGFRLALLCVYEFRDPARGLGVLRSVLDRAPEHDGALRELEKLTGERDLFEEAAEVLEPVYRVRGRKTELAALYGKRVEFADVAADRIEKRRELAAVLRTECEDPKAAQRVLEQGLGDDPTDATLLDELEDMATATRQWREAAEECEKALDASSGVASAAMREVCVRLAGWWREQVRDGAAAERVLEKALVVEPSSDEVLALLEVLQREPGRERQLLVTLRKRAALELDDTGREELMRQAKSLADQLGEPAQSEEILRELLAMDEGNLWGLAELTSVREAAGDYRETFDLLVKRAELYSEGELVRELRHQAAVIARDRLDKQAEAAQLYEALFDDRPDDEVAATALRDLYQSAKRWQELGRLLDRLIDLADSPEQRSALRIELARLYEQQYRAFDSAIGLLYAVLDEQPGHSDGVVILSRLLEETERDEELADLLSSQIEAARVRGDTVAELRFQVRLGEVYDSRLKDRGRAIQTYRDVLEREPQHREALRALARLCQAAQDHAEAANALERLLELSQGEETVRYAGTLADEYGKLGDPERAALALERGLRADERHPALRTRLRALYGSQKNWEKLANLIARDADFLDSAEAKVQLLREAANIHAKRRDDQGSAAALLEQASSLAPHDRELLLQLCEAYSASGRGRAAAEVLERVVESYGAKRSKELADIHRRLAEAYLAEGRSARAVEELDKAFRIEPGNVHVLRRLGEVALEIGETKKAQQMFRALLLQKLDENSPITKAEVFFNLGEVHDKLGERDKAKQMYERAVQADGSFERARQRLASLKS